ncbi:uncharacterized protein LOC130438050 [Triplophysa dalaica]|uniref:uncharacterized protein LOC130438050 n=1 Tax=Triplophysa dalaica TaxID=1582913 RepID=UPI0024DFFCEF|nr:uncharacterized protein LOC130438050 [Triplophysa dalaica]
MEMKDERRFHKLTQEQVKNLDQVLTEVIPIHGRGNFPTLEIKPKDIIHVVRDRLILKNIKVKDVRLNGSTASHVLVKENGTSYKDLDIIFGVELPKQEDFQIIKEVVLGCLLDFLPKGVNKDKITALTMKEAYVQKMVKVFNEHDRWSLISLSNNRGKNVELKFVNSLRRQFEFSVDSFQIILDTMLQSYLEAEKRLVKHREVEQDSSSVHTGRIQSIPTNDQSLNSGEMGHSKECDVDMSCETNDIHSSNDCNRCRNINGSQIEQSTFSEETTIKTVEKVVQTDMTETTVPESMEQESELSFVVHVKDKNELENLSLLTDKPVEANTNVTVGDSATKKELIVLKSEGISGKEITFPTETHFSTTDTNKAEYMLDMGSVNTQQWLELVHTNFSCLSTKGTIGDGCSFQPAPITVLTQTALESCAEYPLAPPAKKNSGSWQMVVLKHSSPKPPRKMSKKAPVLCSPEKSPSDNSNVNTCDDLHPPNAYPTKSLPMHVKLPGLTTKTFELSSASEKDPESKQLVFSTGPLPNATSDNFVHSKETLPIRISPEINLQSRVQNSEPETGEATHVSVLTPLYDPNNPSKDQNRMKQPNTERVDAAHCEAMAPLIHVNSQLLLQADESYHINSTRKENPELYAQGDDSISPNYSTKPSEPVPRATNCLFKLRNPLSTKGSINSKMVGTTSLCSEHVPSPQIHVYTVSSLHNQEPFVPCPQTKEPSELIAHVLEPHNPSSKVQSISVSSPHFTKPLEASISSTASQESSKISEPVLEPAICLDVIDLSKVPLEVNMLKTSDGQADLSSLDTEEPLLSSKALPCITVMAESMYGDFEQAMDHLRYRLIATRNPEEIRGGGLLKYSNLLVRDFKPASETEIKTLERYMCSRFFIDFPDVNEQQRKIESYLRNHFIGEEKSKYDYLMTLRRVVNESTVCLMGHERRQTLNMITILALKVLGEQNIIPNANNVTCYYQPAPYMADHNFSNYYIANGQSQLLFHPYPLHIHMQTGLV